jgi:hypothetical protein
MSLITKRDLQRRYGLPQSEPSENLMHHHHAYWNELNYTLFAGDTRYTTNSFRSVGSKVYLNPVVLMYAVKAELIITATFAGTPDTFSVNLVIGTNSLETTIDTALTYENTVIDISDLIQRYFINFREEQAYIQVKVSNIAVPLDLMGTYLRFTTYMEDTYGDFKNVVSPMLIDKSDINKVYIRDLDEQSKEFEYLSGIKPM